MIRLNYYKTSLLIIMVGLLWSLSLFLLSMVWSYGFLQGLGPTVIVIGILSAYDKWLWKLPILEMLNTIPNLNGVYKGKISYYYGNENREKGCELQIKQTCSTIKVTGSFSKKEENDTKSVSTEAFIKTDQVGDQYLYFYYQNRGSCKNGDTLDQHDGMNVLKIEQTKDSIKLDGYYFTNRNQQTKGCMTVTKQIKEANQ